MVEYYLKEYGTSAFKWAVAGRSQAKLDAVMHQLAAKFPDATVRRLYTRALISA